MAEHNHQGMCDWLDDVFVIYPRTFRRTFIAMLNHVSQNFALAEGTCGWRFVLDWHTSGERSIPR